MHAAKFILGVRQLCARFGLVVEGERDLGRRLYLASGPARHGNPGVHGSQKGIQRRVPLSLP